MNIKFFELIDKAGNAVTLSSSQIVAFKAHLTIPSRSLIYLTSEVNGDNFIEVLTPYNNLRALIEQLHED